MSNKRQDWSPNYALGIHILDTQHRQIFSLCSGIEELAEEGSPQVRQAFHDAINELLQVAAKHFEEEETYLDEIELPDMERHKKEHRDYLEMLSAVAGDSAPGIINTHAVREFTFNWWTNHILQSDMEFKRHVAGAGNELKPDDH